VTDGYNHFRWNHSARTTAPTINNANGWLQAVSNGGNSYLPERHLDTLNVLYCDGHVKAGKIDNVAATKDVGGGFTKVMSNFTIEDD
jgi:prepilin-type processing-associated H-X9-DG protein